MASNKAVVLSIIIVLLLLAPTLLFLYAYISHNSPQSRKPLVIHLLSFSTLNFRIRSASNLLEAEWRANFTFENRYDDCKLHIKPFEVVLYYKEHYAVSCGLVDSIDLEKKKQKRVSIGFNTSSVTGCGEGGQPYGHFDTYVLREIMEEKRKVGSLTGLSLKMNMQSLAYVKGIDRWDLSLDPSCFGINVSFVDARNGKFMGDSYCSIPWY